MTHPNITSLDLAFDRQKVELMVQKLQVVHNSDKEIRELLRLLLLAYHFGVLRNPSVFRDYICELNAPVSDEVIDLLESSLQTGARIEFRQPTANDERS